MSKPFRSAPMKNGIRYDSKGEPIRESDPELTPDPRPCAHRHVGQRGVGGIPDPMCLAPQGDMIHDADYAEGHRYEPLERRAVLPARSDAGLRTVPDGTREFVAFAVEYLRLTPSVAATVRVGDRILAELDAAADHDTRAGTGLDALRELASKAKAATNREEYEGYAADLVRLAAVATPASPGEQNHD